LFFHLRNSKLTRQNQKSRYRFGWREDRGVFVTSLDSVTPLELERSVFDADETRILSTAFERAWAYVEFDPVLGLLEAWERQSELARCLMALLKLGENNPDTCSSRNCSLAKFSFGSKISADRHAKT
jgi:hypothetical protein